MATYTVTHWYDQDRPCQIIGLTLDAAREVARANSAIIGACTIDPDDYADYREVWIGGLLNRKGRFAEVTLVSV